MTQALTVGELVHAFLPNYPPLYYPFFFSFPGKAGKLANGARGNLPEGRTWQSWQTGKRSPRQFAKLAGKISRAALPDCRACWAEAGKLCAGLFARCLANSGPGSLPDCRACRAKAGKVCAGLFARLPGLRLANSAPGSLPDCLACRLGLANSAPGSLPVPGLPG